MHLMVAASTNQSGKHHGNHQAGKQQVLVYLIGEEFDDTEFDGCLDVLNAYRKIEYWYDTEQAMEEL